MSSLIIRVYGIVQGVGFRPFISRIADRFGIKGGVANKGSYVEVHAQGTDKALHAFLEALQNESPERSVILKIDVNKTDEKAAESFKIVESEKESGDIFISPDIATCDKCKRELFDRNNRRYLHPFINCTACGPRLTILDSMPYDRVRTSMGEFPMCPACEYEYTHAETRRYDAQPVCCNDCGPQVYLLGRLERGADAITYTRRAIMDGKIAAVKGIGGFHLCCDASNKKAVDRLRTLKNRPMKPFAVMLRDLDTVKRECVILPGQEKILDGPQKPIILLKKRLVSRLCTQIAPDNPMVGVMLPYAPIQMLLFDYDDDVQMTDCLVMTSGNVSGAPICRNDEDVLHEISGFCDVVLSHDRKIRMRVDDSVMDFLQGKPYMIRRSRGYAPLPFMLSGDFHGQVLGIGGELKNTFCIGKNKLFYPSPYVGDMVDIRTVCALRESIERMETLLEAKPQIVACDMHPRYNTTAVAEELGLPVMKIQHHYAHIVSCMAENDYADDVIGVSFDGTGYGTDGTIWGGEFLKSSYGEFERLGSIRPFLQIGGDASAREGWRIAVSMIYALYRDKAADVISALGLCSQNMMHVQMTMVDKKINSVVSTSTGRLFDAVSAILGVRKVSTFEGEASMALQFAAETYCERHPDISKKVFGAADRILVSGKNRFVLCTDELVKYLTDSVLSGGDTQELAYIFHDVLAEMIAAGCEKARTVTGLDVCALSGGVFQNRLLTEMCVSRLRKRGFTVLLHSLIPPNDGGISLGQAVAAMYRLNQ
ncbi:carbamoyltransferase HypF [uncultured Clostridium sp.]|uniref:carbamoyltransferase HypF n=1 Tax=uncultured Clostridium sp. TaxID=59620 RepID=UPI0025DCC599|nr:carbamoyltransferase HypF [uncultured Clostridium sp.]